MIKLKTNLYKQEERLSAYSGDNRSFLLGEKV